MKPMDRPIIACGMYAFTRELRLAWTELLQGLPAILEPGSKTADSRAHVIFDTTDDIYQSPDLLIGHTCGYPYISKWRETHVPVAVPEFEAPGCQGHEYSSWLVCRGDDLRQKLSEFRNSIAAVNHADSNSGMNVFRYAVRNLAEAAPFFSKISISGSHLESMSMIIRGDADIAAIDAVTFHLAGEADPALVKQLRVLGQSVHSPGLPFIQHRNSPRSAARVLEALNLALEKTSINVSNSLKLRGFIPTTTVHYDEIARLEAAAIQAGYPTLT